MKRKPDLATLAIHGIPARRADWTPVVPPIHQTSTFTNPVGSDEEVMYTRYGNNPTQVALGTKYALMEGTEAALFLSSGMAATALAPRQWRRALRKSTRAIFVETPTNPHLRVIDLAPMAQIARGGGVALLVDATFASPINFRPMEHGADIVITSATKYLNGHSDVIAGAVASTTPIIEEVTRLMGIWGSALDPHAAWLVDRGMRTLAVRVERHNINGMAVARWAEKQTGIVRVHYPGLPNHPDHAHASQVLDGFGGMVGLELKGGARATERFLRKLRLVTHAPSLAGVESLISEPRRTSHNRLTEDQRVRMGVPDGFVRLSCGIESSEDIIADLEQALG
jgi:cystathionine beta-lyase/cystathionine gamma-synthase